MPDDFVSIKDLANELGIDRSHARRYVLKLGLKPEKRRTSNSGGQLTLTLTSEEAEFVRANRREEGFLDSSKSVQSEIGVFYVIQLVPELDPRRIKLGFADNVSTRLAQHRTAAPTAQVLKTWPCKRSWEGTVIDCLAGCGCKLIRNEVFECKDIEQLLRRGDELFTLLPEPSMRVEFSEMSLYNT